MQLSGEETDRSSMNGWTRARGCETLSTATAGRGNASAEGLDVDLERISLDSYTPEEDKGELGTRSVEHGFDDATTESKSRGREGVQRG